MSWGKDEPSLLHTGPSLQYFKKGADGCVMLLCLLLIEVVAYTKRGQRLLVLSSKMFNWSLFLSFLYNFNFFLSAYFFKITPVLLVFVSLAQTQFTLEEGISADELPPWNWPGACLWGILLITGWCGKMQPTVGGVTPEQVGLGYKASWRSPWAALLQGHCFNSCLEFLSSSLSKL